MMPGPKFCPLTVPFCGTWPTDMRKEAFWSAWATVTSSMATPAAARAEFQEALIILDALEEPEADEIRVKLGMLT
jgi:hypothetical protein